jgi:serine/threonine-protein kinase RsbT
MVTKTIFKEEFEITGGDFINAGEVSCRMSNVLKDIGIDPNIILRITVAAYEAEMNVVMYADRGKMYFSVTPDKIKLVIDDEGLGIEDIELAMKPGYSTATKEIREMGFGAGMGLPNMKKNADILNITSNVGKGTKVEIIINLAE